MKNINHNKFKKFKDTFITNYTVKDDNLIVYNDDNLCEVEPYSKEKELELLNTMRKQVESLQSDSSSIKNTLIGNSVSLSFYLYFYINNLSKIHSSNHKEFLILASTLSAFLIASVGKDILRNVSDLKEIKKYSYYIENEDDINKAKESYSNVLTGPSLGITINDIDRYSYSELKDMVELSKTLK